MRGLGNTKLWCHLSMKSGKRHTNKEIRESDATKVSNFEELVAAVARIANHNPEHTLFYRGQRHDYRLKEGDKPSTFYPTIYRKPDRPVTDKLLLKRLEALDSCSRQLLTALEDLKVDRLDRIKKFPELQWSILQHYEVCPTPLLDLTHSLRVAASFALNDAEDHAYVYVFAFPYPQGTITYSTDAELLTIRLLSASPSEALRPHYQQGYLVGSFPLRAESKHFSHDPRSRLVAKFRLSRDKFWSKRFSAVPNSALYPQDDKFREICDQISYKST